MHLFQKKTPQQDVTPQTEWVQVYEQGGWQSGPAAHTRVLGLVEAPPPPGWESKTSSSN